VVRLAHRKMRVPIIAVLLWLFGTAGAWGQNRGPLVLELPASTRALALGNAFVLGSRDSDAIFYQPASVDSLSGLSLGVQRYGSAATLASLSAATGWAAGMLAVGLQVLDYGAAAGELTTPARREAALLTPGPVPVSERVASIAYARRIQGVKVGLTGKVLEQRSGAERGTGGAVDLGIAGRVAPLWVGLAVQNLGPDVSIGNADVAFPRKVTLGASTPSAPVGPLDLLATAAVSHYGDGTVSGAAGAEVAWWPVVGRTFVGRIGARNLGEGDRAAVTLGGAFLGDRFQIEYAYQGFDAPGSAHRVGLSWR
jgi:hypothetical protein